MPFTNFYGNQIIDTMRGVEVTSPSAIWVSLHTDDPGATGSGLEVSGSGYARQRAWMDAASSKSTTSASTLSFPSMPATQVKWASITNVVSGGSQFYMTGSLSGSKIVNAGDTFQFAIGDFDVILV